MVWYMCVLTRPALAAFATANYNHIRLVLGKPQRNSCGELGRFAFEWPNRFVRAGNVQSRLRAACGPGARSGRPPAPALRARQCQPTGREIKRAILLDTRESPSRPAASKG